MEGVEQAAIAISETANLDHDSRAHVRERQAGAGRQDDYKKFAANLAEAGKVALAAAKTKNLDTMLEAGGTVTEACSTCHEVYRDDKEDKNERRCMPPPAK